jgi:hypothetical protein
MRTIRGLRSEFGKVLVSPVANRYWRLAKRVWRAGGNAGRRPLPSTVRGLRSSNSGEGPIPPNGRSTSVEGIAVAAAAD